MTTCMDVFDIASRLCLVWLFCCAVAGALYGWQYGGLEAAMGVPFGALFGIIVFAVGSFLFLAVGLI